MIHVVVSRPRRDHKQRLPWTISAAPLRVRSGWIDARQRVEPVTAGSRAGKGIGSGPGPVYDLAELMIVPAIGIVIEHNQRRIWPLRLALEEVSDLNHELLLIQRIGIARMGVLNSDGFEEAYGRKVSGTNRGKEVVDVVVVIGRIARVTNGFDRVRPGMSRIRG